MHFRIDAQGWMEQACCVAWTAPAQAHARRCMRDRPDTLQGTARTSKIHPPGLASAAVDAGCSSGCACSSASCRATKALTCSSTVPATSTLGIVVQHWGA